MTVFLLAQYNPSKGGFRFHQLWFCLRSQMLGENKDDTYDYVCYRKPKKIFLTEKLMDTTWYQSHISGTSWISSG